MRIAVCGAQHPHVFPRLDLLGARDGVEVVALHEPEARVRDHLAQRYGLPAVASLDELIAAGPQLTILEGLDQENPAYAVALADAGSDLLLEKPGAPGADAMRALVADVAPTGVHAQVGYMLRHSPVMARLKALVDEGALGHITLARFHAAAPVGCAAELWQSLPRDEGGVVYTDGCHMMDAILHLLGRPTAVQGLVKRLPTGPRATSTQYKRDVLAGLGGEAEFGLGELVHEDCGGAILDYPDKLAVFDVTGWEAHGWVEQWRIELYGTEGTAQAGLMPPWLRVGRGDTWDEWRPTGGGPTGAEVSLVADVSYEAELDALLARLERGDRGQDGLREGLAVVETLAAIYRSSREDGRRVAP